MKDRRIMSDSEQQQWSYQPYSPPFSSYNLPMQTWKVVGRIYINAILFVLTIASTWITGGFLYSIAIISILLAHEMGHFLMCRKYGVPATLPYFIPFPIYNPFGTMGAVISMKGYIPSRKSLFDIGAAGPLAGMVVALPLLFIGLAISQVVPQQQAPVNSLELGESLLFKAISWLVLGAQPEGMEVLLHPVAYAGWAGLFVTALNLIPIGQLDGGHVTYAMFGQRSKYFTWAFLASLGVLTIFNTSWALLFALLALFGRRHPSPLDDYTPLDRRRRLIGYLVFIIFILSFTPVPFKI
jgi:membrane-associated protease RseP (regulator of RpoE activity)